MDDADFDRPDDGPVEGAGGMARWVAGLAIAAALVVGVAVYYATEVCDEQVTQTGAVVTACRSLQATDPPVIVLGLVVLVALTAFFSEISGFGISLKRDVRRANQNASKAITKATDAEQTARSAKSTSQVAEELTLTSTSVRSVLGDGDASDALAHVDDLAARYDTIRQQEPSGSSRTSHMTDVVSKMIAALNEVQAGNFDVLAHLSSPDGGHRLAGYAYLYAHPEAPLAGALVRATIEETTPFGQYWALHALRRITSADPSAIDLNSRRELEAMSGRLGSGTDRAYELRQILAEAQQK